MENKVLVPVINQSGHPLPVAETELASGLDLRASLVVPLELKPLQRVLVPTGLYLQLPAGYEAQIRPRSGLALKHGITVLNSPGTIDADYRGEVKVLLVNLSDEPFTIKNGERIAQMIVTTHARIVWELAENLTDTVRGSAGYGSTGMK